MKDQWNAKKLLDVSNAYWRGCTLQAGVRLGIFSTLAEGISAASEIAERIGTDDRGTEFMLNALSAMGLLTKKGDRYRNTAAAREFLCPDSPRYLGHIILHHHHILDGWAQLDSAVKNGTPVEKRSYGAETERESFLMGMFNLASMIAPTLAGNLDLQGRKRLLDLGGGPGTYAIHFCLANPELEAVVFDRPTTQPFAGKTVERFGLGDRIRFLGGDFNTQPIDGGPYDVAWLSQILHSNSPEQCQALFHKVMAVMEPGGLILVHDFILDDSKDAPEFAALFSLNMLVNNSGGRTYSEEEIFRMLTESGAKEPKRLPFRGPNDSSIISAET